MKEKNICNCYDCLPRQSERINRKTNKSNKRVCQNYQVRVNSIPILSINI